MMKIFKAFSLFGIFILLIASCKKDNEDYLILSKKFSLTVKETSQGVLLKWNLPLIRNFSNYMIVRSDSPNYYHPYYYPYRVMIINDFNTTSYIDDEVPCIEKLYYQIYAYGDTVLLSNMQELDREFIDCYAVRHPENSWLYLTNKETGEIEIYDYSLDSVINSRYALLFLYNWNSID